MKARKKTQNPWIEAVLIAAASVFWILVWQFAAVLLDEALILPPPLAVLEKLGVLAGTGEFWLSVLNSLKNVLIGILAGLLLGTLGACLSGAFRPFRLLFTPLLTVIKVTPIAAFILLLVLILKNESIPSFISVLVVVPIVWANVASGIGAIDRGLFEVAKVYRFSFTKCLRILYFPAVRPYLFSSFRSSLGLAWKAGISAEILISPQNTIGRAMSEANQYLLREDLFAWTIVVILLSLLMEKLILALFDRLSAHVIEGGDRHVTA